ncbi:MAG: hypothetical protein Kow0065_18820 [Methylomicrobium sp.]
MKHILNEVLADPDFQEGVAWFRHTFKANETIVNEGDIANTLFVVEKGNLRVLGHVGLEQNKQLKAGFCELKEGDLFGEICLHEIHRRTATVTAITDVEVLEIVGEQLNDFFESHPELGYRFYRKLFEIFTERMKNANKRIENLLAWGLKVHGIEQHL